MEEKYRLGLVSVSFRDHSPREIIEATKDVAKEAFSRCRGNYGEICRYEVSMKMLETMA